MSRGDDQPSRTTNSNSCTNTSPVRNNSSQQQLPSFNTSSTSPVSSNVRSAIHPSSSSVNGPLNTVDASSSSNPRENEGVGSDGSGYMPSSFVNKNFNSSFLQAALPERWSCPAPSTAFGEFATRTQGCDSVRYWLSITFIQIRFIVFRGNWT
mmetsp:Transcript_13797/g.19289  ORF Transcript_13797/g.19289 Transcript_13797/m.19289 type:complete len:153 (+) Transcript_13797:1130-1588(+)